MISSAIKNPKVMPLKVRSFQTKSKKDITNHKLPKGWTAFKIGTIKNNWYMAR